MRRGILVVVALGTLLAGCRDFQLPPLGYQGPLKVVPDHLALAPQAQATLQVEGGTPPYSIDAAGGSGSGTDYLAFPLTTQGSGGFALVDGGQVDYAAGTGDTADEKSTADTFVVRDSKGAKVTVHVAIGPPVALSFGSGGAPRSVAAGGTLLLGATGGKGPYLFGLATAASGGSIDAVTGRYRAGPTGCVSDTLLVRDDLGATASAPVSVQCPARSDSPPEVVAARLTDLGGRNQLFYFTTRGINGGDVEHPVYGGAPLAVPLPGPAVAVAAPHGGAGMVVAVRELDGIHLLTLDATNLAAGGSEPILPGTYPSYPIPPGDPFHLTSGQSITTVPSTTAVATWTTSTGTYAARLQVGQTGGKVVSIPSQTGPGAGAADATVGLFSATGGLALGYVHFWLPAADTSVEAVVDAGGGFGGQPALKVPVTFHALLGAAGSESGDVALLGTVVDPKAPGTYVPAVGVVAYDATNPNQPVFTLQGPVAPVQRDADLIAAGHLRGPYSEDYVVAGRGGSVHLVFFGLSGAGSALHDRATPWFLPAGVRDLYVGDVDGDGLDELLASGDPAGDPTIEVNPSSLPRQAPPTKGVYGAGSLTATSVGTVAVPGERPAILAIDTGHLADGSLPAKGAGGELTLLTGGADVGDPKPVILPVAGGVVTQVVAARLRPNTLGLPHNPSDLVAVVEAGGSAQVWVARFTRPGLPPVVAPLGGAKSPTSFPNAHLGVLPVPKTSPARDAVVLVDDEGLRALRWDAKAGRVGLSALVAGTYGWPVPNVGDTRYPDDLVALHPGASDLTVARVGLDAAGTSLVTSDILGVQTRQPVSLVAPPGVDWQHVPTIAHGGGSYGELVALAAGGSLHLLGLTDSPQCTLDVPGTVSAVAVIRPTSDGMALVADLDAPDGVLRTLKIFGGYGGDAVVDRQPLQGVPTSVAAGDVVGGDQVPDVVVGGTPLMVFPGVPDALVTERRQVSCQ